MAVCAVEDFLVAGEDNIQQVLKLPKYLTFDLKFIDAVANVLMLQGRGRFEVVKNLEDRSQLLN